MGEDRTGEPRDEPQTNQRLTVAQAAATLGITEGAVRSRIKRGTLPTVKEGGTVYVVFSGTSGANHPPYIGELSDQSDLVESLQDQVAYLRQQLAEEREARRRADTIIAQLTQANATLAARIPELEAPPEPREPPETVAEPSDPAEPRSTTEGPQEQTTQRAWWRKLLGG